MWKEYTEKSQNLTFVSFVSINDMNIIWNKPVFFSKCASCEWCASLSSNMASIPFQLSLQVYVLRESQACFGTECKSIKQCNRSTNRKLALSFINYQCNSSIFNCMQYSQEWNLESDTDPCGNVCSAVMERFTGT